MTLKIQGQEYKICMILRKQKSRWSIANRFYIDYIIYRKKYSLNQEYAKKGLIKREDC